MKELKIGKTVVLPGERKQLELYVAKLFDFTKMTIPVEVIRGEKDGPTLFISAAIHGDEINGTEIIKRLLSKKKLLSEIQGTLIAVPIVNVFGFNTKQRYLPDRRDLNRCFPGSKTGPLAHQIAHVFMSQVVDKCTHGIDLHTGSIHRYNLPQIRACLDDKETKRLARAFGMPVMLNSSLRDGSLREAVMKKGVPVLLFEGGEALRYDENVIRQALVGITNVMRAIGMTETTQAQRQEPARDVFIANVSRWMRAPQSGSLRIKKRVGSRVKKGEVLGVVSDPYGDNKVNMTSSLEGIIIGITQVPLLNRGDAAFHVAAFNNSGAVKDSIEMLQEDEMYEPPYPPVEY